MKIETAKKAAEIVKEIEQLSKYTTLLENGNYREVVHFELCQHYGENPDKVVINHKYTTRLLLTIEEIIKELKNELSEL